MGQLQADSPSPYYPEKSQGNHQFQPSYEQGNDPTNQEDLQPPPSAPPQYPQQTAQANPSYQTLQAPSPQNNQQTNPIYPNQPTQFPQHNPQMNLMYATQPLQFPPQNLQTNPECQLQQPSSRSHPPQANSQPTWPYVGYHPQPVQYPTPTHTPQFIMQANVHMPPSPLNPPVQQNGAAQGIPLQQSYPPSMTMPMPIATAGWTTGLFGCMDDPINALITILFPCLTFGQVAEILDSGHTSCGTSGLLYGAIAFFIGFPCLISCTYRTKLRSKFGLVESPAPDWVIHFLCEYCALCQEYRELHNRGLEPSLGWQGNMAKAQMMQQQQQQEVHMVPPTNQTMVG